MRRSRTGIPRRPCGAPRNDSGRGGPGWLRVEPGAQRAEADQAPRLLVAAKDMHFTAHDGRKVLDGTAGLWCVNAGHGREKIINAVKAQLDRLDFAPTFQMGHPMAFEAAQKIAALAPTGGLCGSLSFHWSDAPPG